MRPEFSRHVVHPTWMPATPRESATTACRPALGGLAIASSSIALLLNRPHSVSRSPVDGTTPSANIISSDPLQPHLLSSRPLLPCPSQQVSPRTVGQPPRSRIVGSPPCLICIQAVGSVAGEPAIGRPRSISLSSPRQRPMGPSSYSNRLVPIS